MTLLGSTGASVSVPPYTHTPWCGIHLRDWDGRELTDEDGPDGKRHPLLVDVGLVELVEHAVQRRHVPVLVPDDGEIEIRAGGGEGVDVFYPVVVGSNVVGGEADELRG